MQNRSGAPGFSGLGGGGMLKQEAECRLSWHQAYQGNHVY